MARSRREPKSEVSLLVKYLLFFFNFLIWLASIAVIGIGVYANIEKDKYLPESGIDTKNIDIYDVLFDLTIIFMVVGSCLFLISFLGCIGALRENICVLNLFALAIGVIFLLEVVAAVLAFVFKNEIVKQAEAVLRDEGIEKYRDDPDWHDFVNWVQEEFECCGVSEKSYQDWSKNIYFNCSDENRSPEACGVPYSCCTHPDDITKDVVNTMCGYGAQNLQITEASDVIFTEGCIQRLIDVAEKNLYIVGGVAIGVAVVQLLGILFARLLAGQVETTKAYAA